MPETLLRWAFTWTAAKVAAADPTARAYLATRDVYLFYDKGEPDRVGGTVIPGQLVKDVGALTSGGTPLLAGVEMVYADLEKWAETPVGEQADPVGAVQALAAWAKPRPLLVGASIGRDLGLPIPKTAAAMAPVLDLFEVQAQGLQHDPAAYAALVHETVGAVHHVNPRVHVLAVLSASIVGTTLATLQAAITPVAHGVAGVRFNCQDDAAQIAVMQAFLAWCAATGA